MKVCSLTDIGTRREMNEDYFFASEDPVGALPNLFLIADGMGGHSAGDFASRNAVETICDVARTTRKVKIQNILKEGLERSNTMLREYAGENPKTKGMGTTIVAAVLVDHALTVANVGDSKLYVLGDTIRQVTEDHSLVHEMVMRGEIDEETAKSHPDKNIITRAVGASDTVKGDFFEETLKEGELVLMCTDGLANMVEEEQILSVMRGRGKLEKKTQHLVELANEHGGKDNITVITIDPEFER